MAEAFVTGTLELEVNPSCSESEIESVAKAQSGNVIWSYNGTIDGTVHVERIEHIGDMNISK